MNKLAQAAALFQGFFDRVPVRGDVVQVAPQPAEIGVRIGRVTHLGYLPEYDVDNDNAPFIHKFTKNRPLLVISYDGSQAYILMGGYRFTERGFVG